jgi:uncharacterized membrane protein YfcA
MMTIVIYVAIGLVIGSLSGMMGIGGGVLLVPALMWLCGMKSGAAAGTSLAILIPPIGLPAAWRAYNENQVDLAAALWIAAAYTIGAYFSRGLVAYIPQDWFRLVFGLLMIFVAVRFMLAADSEVASAAAGLSAALIGLLGYLGLKWVGRRHLPLRTLGQHIQEKHEEKRGEADYHI